MDFRVECDSMGQVRVPHTGLYGTQTQRAVENFPISANRFQSQFIKALGLIKACTARANGELGFLPHKLSPAIAKEADHIAAGRYYDQFVVEIFQTGSGRSTNMNANEVIAGLTGAHPNDHVNRSPIQQ